MLRGLSYVPSSSEGKRELRGTTSPPPHTVDHFVGPTTLIFPTETVVQSPGFNLWEPDCDRAGVRGLQQRACPSWQTKFIPAGLEW